MLPSLDSIIAVTAAGFALSVTPGPSMLYVLSRSVGQSRMAGIASAIGLGLGGVILAILTALGLAAIFTKFSGIAVVLRYIGSAYLIYLGVTMIAEARANATVKLEVEKVKSITLSTVIWQGVWVEFLNPKTVLFFVLFLPPFVTADPTTQGDVKLQLLILGVLVPITAVPSDLVVAYLGGTLASTINGKQVLREALAWLGGLILILIAINLHYPVLSALKIIQ